MANDERSDASPGGEPLLSWTPAIGRLIDLALEEDLGRGDVTTEVVGERRRATGRIICRQEVVVCGLRVASWIVARAEPSVRVRHAAADGDCLQPGGELTRLKGAADAILRVERTVLNFLARLSGVATLTRRYCRELAGTPARVVDTRKTLPGWRVLDKYAVRVGGGANHRADLGSGILIKDNHIAACGSLTAAVRRARSRAPHPLRVEVEVESVAGAAEALAAGAEVLLLDNMAAAEVAQVVARTGGRAIIEVSGGVTLESVRALAEAGADVISVGALTHSAPAVDLSLELAAEAR